MVSNGPGPRPGGAGSNRLGPLLLTRPVGRGGMGTVWHARHPDGVDVAVKVLRPEYADNPDVLEAFRREVRAVAALDHPGVVRVFDYGVVPESLSTPDDPIVAGTPWLSMEYAPDGTLGDRTGASSWATLRDVLAQVLDGLAHSHARDIVHRDLKPRNVLVASAEPGRPERVTLTDYGIAHALSQRSAHRAQAGTPGYMAPEQIQGEWRDLGPWTDLYSLGALAWRLATGRSAFLGDRPATVLYAQLHGKLGEFKPTCEVPSGFEGWIRRLLEVRPSARYPSAADAVAGLRALDRREAAGPVPLDWRPRYPPTTVAPNGTGLALFVLRPWPLVGREKVQDQLWVALNRVATTRKADGVVLSGARGVGKTRLATWLVERAAETGAAWVLRAPSSRGAGPVMVRAARALLRIEDLPPEESKVRLTRWFVERGSATPETDADAVLELLSGDSPRVGRLDPWSLLIDRLAQDRPLIVAVDDLHREREAVDWLGRVIGTDRAVLVVATMERSASPPFRDKIDELRPSVRWIEVPPLTREQQRELVDAGVGLEPRLADQVVERTAGDPALAVKVVADWAKRGILVPTSHGFGLKDRSDARVDEPLVEELDARMSGLGERVVRTLEVLAVLGGARVVRSEWQAVCASAGNPLSSGDVDALRSSGHLVTTDEGGVGRVSLEPPPIRDLLKHRATAGERMKAYHEAAAAVLSALPKASARERAVIHFVDAGLPNRALTQLRSLIDESERQGQARRLPTMLAFEGRLLDAMRVSATDHRRLPNQLDLLQNDLNEGVQVDISHARRLLSRAVAYGDPLLCARATRIVLSMEAETLDAEDPQFDEALRWHELAHDVRGRRVVWALRAQAAWREGSVERAEQMLAAILAETDERLERARILTLLGEVRGDAGGADLAEAKDIFVAEARTIEAASVDLVLSRVRRRAGDLVGALEHGRLARAELRRRDADPSPADLQVGLARLARGEVTQARLELDKACDSPVQGVARVARAARLACLPPGPDWALFDAELDALERQGDTSDPDAGWPLEWAAKRVADAGGRERAARLYGLAADRYAAAGDEVAADRARKRRKHLTR